MNTKYLSILFTIITIAICVIAYNSGIGHQRLEDNHKQGQVILEQIAKEPPVEILKVESYVKNASTGEKGYLLSGKRGNDFYPSEDGALPDTTFGFKRIKVGSEYEYQALVGVSLPQK